MVTRLFATECLAHRLSPTIAALLNVSFGNSVELIIFIIALVPQRSRKTPFYQLFGDVAKRKT